MSELAMTTDGKTEAEYIAEFDAMMVQAQAVLARIDVKQQEIARLRRETDEAMANLDARLAKF